MNKRGKTVTGVIVGIIILLLLAGGGFLLYRGVAARSSANDPAKFRLNTLTLVRTYVEKEEFDRALSLLEGLLIKDPSDTEASELLDIVLQAKKAKLAREAGTGMDRGDIEAALAEARGASARIA